MKFIIWNANAREELEAESAQKAADKFISIHPHEIHNVINIREVKK